MERPSRLGDRMTTEFRSPVPSAMARGIDPRLASNRFALGGFAAALAVLGGVAFFTDRTFLEAVFGAVAVFLGWAIGRELDPDTPRVAAFSLVLALAFAVFAAPSALVTGVALIGVRLVAGTVGAPVSVFDLIVLPVIGVLAALTPSLWIVGIAIAMWLLRAPEVGRLRTIATVAFLAGAAGGLAFMYWEWSEGRLADVEIGFAAYGLAALAGLAMMLAARPVRVTVQTDCRSGPVDPVRIRFARMAAGAFSMWAAVMGGTEAFWAMGPVFAALVVAAVFRVFVQPANVED